MKNIFILCESLTSEISDYFETRPFVLLDSDKEFNYADIDYILIDRESEVKDVSKTYSADKNNIQIICLSEVYDQKTFLTFNGRLSLDSEYFKSSIGIKILDKFFSEKYSLHLADHFEDDLKNVKSFKITNHLSSGLYLDEVSVDSFEAGFNLVSMRSYLDHIINYFTYLKQAGLAGVPYEVEYAHNEDFFVLNTYLTVRDFVAEYMIDSFGRVNSKDPMKYLLGVAAEASDFMEITYFENPGRLAITAIWNKESRNYGTSVALHNIESFSEIRNKVDHQIKSFNNFKQEHKVNVEKQKRMSNFDLPGGITDLIDSELNESLSQFKDETKELVAILIARVEQRDENIDDLKIEDIKQLISEVPETEFIKSLEKQDIEVLLDKVQNKNIAKGIKEKISVARENLNLEEEFQNKLKNSLSGEISKNVSSALDIEAINKILSSHDEKQERQIIKGSKETKELVQTIKGLREEQDNSVQIIQESFGEDQDELKQIISGNDDPLEKKALFRKLVDGRVASIDADSGLFENSVSKDYLKTVLPAEIELGLEEYAKKIGKTFESLSAFELDAFQEEEMPNIIDRFISNDDLVEAYVEEEEEKFKLDSEKQFALRQALKVKLEQSLEKKDEIERIDGVFVLTEENFEDEAFKQILEDSMKDSLDESVDLFEGSIEEIDCKKEEIINSFTTLNDDPFIVSEAVSSAIEQTKILEVREVAKSITALKEIKETASDDRSNIEKELLKRIKESELRYKKLEMQNKLLEGHLKAEGQASKKLEKINDKLDKKYNDLKDKDQKTEKSLVETSELGEVLNEKAKENLIENLSHNQPLSPDQSEMIKEVFEREKKLLSISKSYELDIRKLEHDLKHKDALFHSEVVRVERMSKGKDIVLEKTKANLTALVQQKEKFVKDLQEQVHTLNKKMKNDQTAILKKDMLKLKKDNELLAKSAEMFKNRLESMSKMNQSKSQKSDVEKIAEEHRVLKNEKIGLVNKVKGLERDVRTWEMRFEKVQELEIRQKDETASLKKKIDFAEEQIRTLKSDSSKKREDVPIQKQDIQSKKEVQNLKSQNAQLQNKLKELMDKSKGKTSAGNSGMQSSTPKEKILEKDKKRLQQEYTKSKLEAETFKKGAIKLKNENTKLQIAADKYQKDITRLEKKLKALASLSGKKAA